MILFSTMTITQVTIAIKITITTPTTLITLIIQMRLITQKAPKILTLIIKKTIITTRRTSTTQMITTQIVKITTLRPAKQTKKPQIILIQPQIIVIMLLKIRTNLQTEMKNTRIIKKVTFLVKEKLKLWNLPKVRLENQLKMEISIRRVQRRHLIQKEISRILNCLIKLR